MSRPTNRGQLEATLRELRRMGRLEPVDAAAVQALRSMALQLDLEPGLASLWRQYVLLVRELTADDDDGSSPDLAAMYAAMGDSPPS